MFKRLKKAIFGPPPPPKVPEFTHPELGLLKSDEEVDSWVVQVEAEGDSFSFAIDGEETPDELSCQHALEILRDYSAFKKMLADFTEDHIESSGKWKERRDYVDEVRALVLDQIALWQPAESRKGMVFFTGPDEYRCWRCDFADGKAEGLAFDD